MIECHFEMELEEMNRVQMPSGVELLEMLALTDRHEG